MGAFAAAFALALALAASSWAQPAFPGCEGFGCETPGGRGGRVLAVTSLANAGPGTLREALDREGPRIVVFRVAGYITLESPLVVREPYLTVAGQTAPGSGVTLRNKLESERGLASDSFTSLVIETHDVVIRHLAIRPGVWPEDPSCSRTSEPSAGGATCVDANDVQAIEIDAPAHAVVLDHLSLSHVTDEALDVGGATDLALQWSILSHGYTSYPYCGVRTSCDAWGGKGAQMGDVETADRPTTRISVHHNLFAHLAARLPQVTGVSDVRENVAYDWREHGADIHNLLGPTEANYVGNRAIPGPATRRPRNAVMLHDWACGAGGGCTRNPLRVFTDASVNCVRQEGERWRHCSLDDYRLAAPVRAPAVSRGGDVLGAAGASLRLEADGRLAPRRDAIDAATVRDVRERSGRAPGREDPVPWPAVSSGAPYADADEDGMADAWERARGLDPTRADGARDADGDGWPELEAFLSGAEPLAAPPPPTPLR